MPRAVLSNTYANLSLVGTKCFFKDAKYLELDALVCDRYYPGGTLLSMDADGNIGGMHTWSDLGRLDYAFNDYLNFLMAIRQIYEAERSSPEKASQIEVLGLTTGRQGHSYSLFIEKHGGARQVLSKCRGFHP